MTCTALKAFMMATIVGLPICFPANAKEAKPQWEVVADTCNKMAGVPADNAGYVAAARWRRALAMDCGDFADAHHRFPTAEEMKQLIGVAKKEDAGHEEDVRSEAAADPQGAAATGIGLYEVSSGNQAAKYYNEVMDILNRILAARHAGPGSDTLKLQNDSFAIEIDLAGAALRKGNLDAADRLYRSALLDPAADNFSDVRARAQLGVDDVRARRR